MIRKATLATAVAATLAACAPPSTPSRAADLYTENCASCHGVSAQGDGPVAAEFAVKPANLTLLSQRNGGVFPMEDVMAQINGYEGRHQFGGMPEFGRQLGGPMVDYVSMSGEIIPTPKALIDLARYLESIQQ